MGSPHKIIIYLDHLNLQYWRLLQRISRRVAREVLELSKYDFEIRCKDVRVLGEFEGGEDLPPRKGKKMTMSKQTS